MTALRTVQDALSASARRVPPFANRLNARQCSFVSGSIRRHHAFQSLCRHSSFSHSLISLHNPSYRTASSNLKGYLLNRPPSSSARPSQASPSQNVANQARLWSNFRSALDFHQFHRARRRSTLGVRWKSSSAKNSASKSSSHKEAESIASKAKKQVSKASPEAARREYNYILNKLPDLSHRFHRPSKEDLLAAATGFWSRLRVHFKWFSIRSVRPFNIDDISAFATWALATQLIWIILGTTTFFSLLILTVNTVFAQETLASWVGDYLTHSSGIKVVFESAIVPKWKDGVITFHNVFVSRRPGQGKSKVRKGSPSAEAVSNVNEPPSSEEEDSNYTQFDVSLETVNVTLSFAKWWSGKGFLKDVEVKGVRGVVDRTSVHWPAQYIDPRSYRHEHNTGDFEIESFKMEDLLLSIHQPGGFRPFSVSVFSADLPQLRKQWLFYDLLSANHISGSFDESAFFIHPRQLHNVTAATLPSQGSSDEPGNWKKQSRVRIDGLNIDHLNRGVEGPFSWIHKGNVDIAADVMFPADDDESIARIVSEFYDKVEASVSNNRFIHPHTPSRRAASDPETEAKPDPTRYLVMDLRVHLNDVHAGVPLFTRDLSYVNNALVRPIVAYINNQKTFIPINCRVVKQVDEFDGSWTIYDSGLMEDLSRESYDAFARDVVDDQARMRRIKKVGLWSLQLAVQALVLGLAGNVA